MSSRGHLYFTDLQPHKVPLMFSHRVYHNDTILRNGSTPNYHLRRVYWAVFGRSFSAKDFSMLVAAAAAAVALTVTTWTSAAEGRRTGRRPGIVASVWTPQTRNCCCPPRSVSGVCVCYCIYWRSSANLGVKHRPPSLQARHALTHAYTAGDVMVRSGDTTKSRIYHYWSCRGSTSAISGLFMAVCHLDISQKAEMKHISSPSAINLTKKKH